jgi:hypothetical protein
VKQDSTTSTSKPIFDKIWILQSLTFSGNYNFAVDSFQLSTISFAARNSFFKQKIGLNLNGTLDPYQINEKGNRINQYTLKNGQLGRLTSLGLSVDLNLKSGTRKKKDAKNINNQYNLIDKL